MAVNRIFGAISLTGGSSGALDDISIGVLTNNDLAVAKDSDFDSIHFYRYDIFASDGEDSPSIIEPDDSMSTGRWILISPRYFVENLEVEPGKYIVVNEIFGNDSGLSLGYNSDGPVSTLSMTNAGSGFTDGTYVDEPTSGGSGSGLTVDVTVLLGSISVISVNQTGDGYVLEDEIVVNNFVSTVELSVTGVDNLSINIQSSKITISTSTDFNDNVVFKYSGGSPFNVNGNQTMVDDLNTELHGGEPISNVSLLDDNTNKYSVLPQVTELTVVPSVDEDLATKKYVDDEISGNSPLHSSLSALDEDDHTQYILSTGDRSGVGFSAVISGSTPILDQHLSTKGYVDDEIIALGLGGTGDYILKDGSNTATGIIEYDVSIDFAALDAGDTQGFASVNYIQTYSSNHLSATDPHIQYLRNNANDTTTGTISSDIHVSTSQGNLTTRAEIDGLLESVYTQTSATDGYTDVVSGNYVSNIVRKDVPKSDRSLYTADILETSNDNLINYAYLSARLINLLEYDNTIVRGKVLEVDITTAGTGYSTGVVSPTGGSGAGLSVDITSIGGSGEITGVDISFEGSNYVLDEVVTVPGGTGGTLTLNEVTTGASHSDLYDLQGTDDHTQYILADSSREFDNTVDYPSVFDETILPSINNHLTTKIYVDNQVQGFITTDGSSQILNNQAYIPKYPYDYFVENNDGQSDITDLVNKSYVDLYSGLVLNSSTDRSFSFLKDAIAGDAWTNTLDLTIADGSVSGLIIQNRYALEGKINGSGVADGGSGFLVIDAGSVSYPQTIGTGSVTNFPTFDSSGTDSLYIETSVELDETGNVTADVRILSVIGDVGIVEIQDAGTGYAVNDVISFFGNGTGSTWEVASIGGSGEITGVQRLTTQTDTYTYAVLSSITTSGGSGASLVPYIVGGMVSIKIYDPGTGYTGATFRYAPGSAVDDGFTWSGFGTTTDDTDDTNIDIVLINPRTEKLSFNHYGTDTLETAVGTSPFTASSGQVITGLSFDEWGHIIDISTSGTPSGVWEIIDDTDSPVSITKNYRYLADTSSGTIEVKLNDTPSLGDTSLIDDFEENSSVNNITINDFDGNNLKVTGDDTTPYVIDVDGARVLLTYVDPTYGWRVKTF